MSGVSCMINGSEVKYGWHQSVSGAVGAICLHFNVDSTVDKGVCGGDGRYLNISFTGWPECRRKVRVICVESEER